MKKEVYPIRLLGILMIIVVATACEKTAPTVAEKPLQTLAHADSQATKEVNTTPYPINTVVGCGYAPNYGDSIVYPQPTTGSDYIVSPINNPGSGKYLSWPQGLDINSTTGAIDVTQSQTGERFDIGFVLNGTTDTCMTSLIIAGASYMDSDYVIADHETQAFPYFNANPSGPTVCGTSGACQFDVTGSARNERFIVNTSTGMIDLQKSLNNGIFGPAPYNGEVVPVLLYYRLNDGSNMALQNIWINFAYYYSKSQIPAGTILNVNNRLHNIMSDILIMNTGNPRPPLIIITRFN